MAPFWQGLNWSQGSTDVTASPEVEVVGKISALVVFKSANVLAVVSMSPLTVSSVTLESCVVDEGSPLAVSSKSPEERVVNPGLTLLVWSQSADVVVCVSISGLVSFKSPEDVKSITSVIVVDSVMLSILAVCVVSTSWHNAPETF